jgi:ribosome-binding factor A
MRSTAPSVKRRQKESLYFKTITQLIADTCRDDAELSNFFVTRIGMSPDGGVCTVYIYSPAGAEHSNKVVGRLIVYKPSLRKALATAISVRRVPEIIFDYDSRFEKQERLEAILNALALESREQENSFDDTGEEAE